MGIRTIEPPSRVSAALVATVAVAVFILVPLAAAAQAAAGAADRATPPRVTASTAWTAAIAEAAGAEVGRILAPVELRHPPEYDFRPGDIRYAVQADYLIWAGYEGFMRSLFEAAGVTEDRILQVHTNNTPPVLKGVVRDLSVSLGTLDRFSRWERELDELTDALIAGSRRTDVGATRAVVHMHYRVLAEWLGYEIVAELTMSELTPTRLREILALEPDLVIDNWHNPTGEPLRNDAPAYVTLINFPGRDGTRTLLDVLRYNGSRLGLLE